LQMKAGLLLVVGMAVASQEFEERIKNARLEYDLDGAREIVTEIGEVIPLDAGEEEQYMAARAILLLTELKRFDFEERYEELSRQERREIGREIDDIAKDGMDRIARMAESSERYRLEADFIALQIRSKYHATKFRKRMTEAADRALEMDPDNAHAYVSVCRPYLFAKPKQGGDVGKALELLNKAVDLDPTLEMASVFLAIAYDKMGEADRAEEILKQVVEYNPHSKIATERLDRIREGLEKAEDR